MQFEIKSFNGSQSGKVLALVFFFFGLILAVIVGLARLLDWPSQADPPPLMLIAALPFAYAIAAYLGARIFIALYNRVAARRGGISMELGELYDPMAPPWKP